MSASMPENLPHRFRNQVEVDARQGRTDWRRVDAATVEEIEQWQHEEGFDEADEVPIVGSAVIKPGVIPETDMRGLREYLDLTQEEFASRYCLPLDDVQAWEQHTRKPDGAARNFLWLITRNPKAIAEQLATSPLAAYSTFLIEVAKQV